MLEGEPNQADQVGDGVPIRAPDVRVLGVDLQGRVGVPQQVGGPVARGPLDPLGQLTEFHESDFGLAVLGVQQLQGGDLVLVLLEVGLPGGDDLTGTVGVDDAASIEQEILAGLVDDEVVGLADLQQPVPKLRVRG